MGMYTALAYTMQALVKYHGLRDWNLRLPYHDSISVNTDCMMTKATIVDKAMDGGVYIKGKRDEQAEERISPVIKKLSGNRRSLYDIRIDSENIPDINAKGLGFSSSAGAALTLLCHKLFVGNKPDLRDLSRVARLFAASASRALVGGFARLYAGKDDESTYAVRFADSRVMDLRMVIVPLSSNVKTEDAHREVETSPFFRARIRSAQKRCDEMEKAILANDIRKVGELAEMDTLELHSVTMTGGKRLILITEDSIRIMRKVRELRSEGIDAYFSLQTGPSVFINTSERDQEKILNEIRRMGYSAYCSAVGGEARIIE